MSDSRWRRRVARLRQMEWPEIRGRGLQECYKRADALFARLGFDFAKSLVQSANVNPGQFFFATESITLLLEVIRLRLPQQAAQIIRQADKICFHRFDLLGYEDLDFGDPINWHLDPVHEKCSPKKTFYRVPFLDFATVGDSKVVWELNRHQHFVTLAKAYRLTNEKRYADEILNQWHHWHAENPYSVGINWASSLEVAFRSLSWTWMYQLLEDTPALPPKFRKEWLRAQALNGRHIERYLSTYFSPNTHLLGEAVALLFLGTMCPELSPAERWKTQAWEIILRESQRQVLPDGFHFEQSTYYHVYAIDFLLHAAVFASLNQITLPTEFEETLEKMLDALLVLGRNGSPPRIGDDDGGRLFDPRRNRSEHLLDPLTTGAVLFHRGDFKAAPGELREETIWLLGAHGVVEWDRLQEKAVAAKSATLQSAGLYLLTNATSSSHLVVRAAPNALKAGHSHADALSVCLRFQGSEMLIDPGTFAYINPERDLFRSTAMHNTLRVDGASQSTPAGPFGWKYLAHARVDRSITGETFDFLAGSHNGRQLASPVLHRRWIFSLNAGSSPGFFLVRDVAEGTDKHRLDIAWHLGPEMQLRAERVFGVKGSSTGLAILCTEKHSWAEEVRKDFWSPVYGKKEPVTVLNFGLNADLPAEFVTLLIPLEEVRGVPGKLTHIPAPASIPKAYLYSTSSEEFMFFFGKTGEPWSQKEVASDAEFVCWQKKRDLGDQLLILCHGSYLEIAGDRVINCRRSIERCEVIIRDGRKEIYASDPDALVS